MSCAILLVMVTNILLPAAELDFAPATTGQSYRIELAVRDANGNLLVSGPVAIGAGADVTDIRDTISDVLGDSGLQIVTAGDAKLRLQSKGGTRLGTITYDTFVKGLPTALAGPKLLSATGGASLTVNGVVAKP